MSPAASKLGHALFFALAIPLGAGLGDSYIARLSDRRGFHLIAVDDVVKEAHVPPRHTVLILIDGLRLDFARRTEVANRLAPIARCFRTSVGLPSVSAPVYAEISTGLEQDRTGVRNNDDHSKVSAESIWTIAKSSGLRVLGRSDISWWKEMFPEGFSEYETVGSRVGRDALDITGVLELPDLLLLHPGYVDDTGHDFGARSPEYQRAVDRADAGMMKVLDRLDLAQDLAIITADHGHAMRGGHGGSEPEIEEVLTCFAGKGVARPTTDHLLPRMRASTIGPSIAMLLGLRFPRTMRAGEDDLDTTFTITSSSAFSLAYLADRRAAIARFREANEAELGRELGKPRARWSDWNASERSKQGTRAGVLLAIASAALIWWMRRSRERGTAAFFLPWAIAIAGSFYLAHRVILGVFDFTCINERSAYIIRESTTAVIAMAIGVLIHVVVQRRMRLLVRDLALIVLVIASIELAHVAAYGWPMEAPLPETVLFFVPFPLSILHVGACVFGICATIAAAILKSPFDSSPARTERHVRARRRL